MLRMLWVVVGCVQTVYALAYDVIMDWGLLDGSGKWRLRANIIYPRAGVCCPSVLNTTPRFCALLVVQVLSLWQPMHGCGNAAYYCAAAANIVLRWAWLSRLLVYPAWIGGRMRWHWVG